MQKQTAGEKHMWAVMSSVCKAVTGAFMFIFARACVASGPGIYFANEKTGLELSFTRFDRLNLGFQVLCPVLPLLMCVCDAFPATEGRSGPTFHVRVLL